jgi:pyrroloquinoline-quinone synthase
MEKEVTFLDEFTLTLKDQVNNHHVLSHPWFLSRSKKIDLNDLLLWLSQEYFVSLGFVDWFLIVAASTPDQQAKIVLVENIWEELGEGNISDTHVSILEKFMISLGVDPKESEILSETSEYLADMKDIISKGFYFGLGALGPANEYLLKLEYSKIAESYSQLKERLGLPEGKFFQVNLDADSGHSKRMFDLISLSAKTREQKEMVKEGNRLALDAREKFYFGIDRVSQVKSISD